MLGRRAVHTVQKGSRMRIGERKIVIIIRMLGILVILISRSLGQIVSFLIQFNILPIML